MWYAISDNICIFCNDKNIDIFIQTNQELPSSLEVQTTLKNSVQNKILNKLLNMGNCTEKF